MSAPRKLTITPRRFVSEVAAIAAQAPLFHKVWVRRELDPGLRELLMVAVAQANGARFCGWAHHEWARIEGVSEKALAQLERMDRARIDPRTWAAIAYVRELTATRFGPVPKDLMRELRAHYSAGEIEEITLVARVMDLANRGSNTFDALLSRLGGKRPLKGPILDEAIMSAAVLGAMPPLFLYFSRATKRPITEVAQGMLDYITGMSAEMAPAAPKGKAAPKRKAAAKRTAAPKRKRISPGRAQPARARARQAR